jgi:hypothetical protein
MFPIKLKIELPYEPTIAPLGIYTKQYKSGFNRDNSTVIFTAALFTITMLGNQSRCSSTDK